MSGPAAKRLLPSWRNMGFGSKKLNAGSGYGSNIVARLWASMSSRAPDMMKGRAELSTLGTTLRRIRDD